MKGSTRPPRGASAAAASAAPSFATASCRLLLHLIDGASDDPAADFTKINEELRPSTPSSRKLQVVLLTKADLPEVEPEVEARLESLRAVVPHGRLGHL